MASPPKIPKLDKSSKTDRTSDRDEDQVDWDNQLLHAIRLPVRRSEKDPEKVRLDQIQLCLEKGSANINDSAGNTVLHMAVQEGYRRTVKFLLQREARTDISNQNGETATTLAGFSQNRKIRKLVAQRNGMEVPRTSGNNDLALVADEPQPSTSRGEDIVTQMESAIVEDNSTGIASEEEPHSNDRATKTYEAGDNLNKFWPGVVYQLQHLTLTLHCALQQENPSLLLATEMVEAGKLDDIILLYKNNKGEQVGRFEQVKCTEGEMSIHAGELLKNDDDFSLRRYFISWRENNKNKLFDQITVKNFILRTTWNIDDLHKLKKNGIHCQRVEEPSKSFEVMRYPKNKLPATAWYKFPANETDNAKIYEKLREASDFYVLAKKLVECLCGKNKFVRENIKILRKYHVALVKHVFNVRSRKFHAKFKRKGDSSQEVKKFRKIFLSEYRKMANDSSVDSSNKPAWDKIEEKLKKLELPENFGKQGSEPTDSKLPADDCVDDEEIETFLKEFTLTVNQPNEDELNEIIRLKLGADSRFNLLNTKLLGNALRMEILDWFLKKNKDKKRKEYLSYKVGEKFLKDMENEIDSLKTVGSMMEYCERMKAYQVHFESEMQPLKDFLTDNELNFKSNRVLEIVVPKDTLLTALRVYDALEHIPGYSRRDSFIFMSANSLGYPSILGTVMATFSSQDHPDLLVIDCESNSAERYLEKLWSPLCEIIAKKVNKRMIVIAQTGEDLGTQFQLGRHTHRVQEDDCSFRNLEIASQKRLLGKPVTTFQGRKTEKSIGELLGICESDNLGKEELDELSEVIDSDTLLEIICKREISIGEDLPGLEEIDEYYINRTISRHVVIKKDIFDDKKRPDLIAISEIDGILPGILVGIEETSTMVETFTDVTTLDKNQEEEQFNALCAENKDRNVHWLMKEPAKDTQTQSEDEYKYTWNRSSGDISYLIKFRDVGKSDDEDGIKGATEVSESDLAARDEPVIISDAAGMGKTTLLTYVANEMKKQEPDMLVLEIDLNRHCTALEKVREQSSYDLSNDNEAIQFLAKELASRESSLAQKVFEKMIKSRRKVALIFDGFDEISPTHEDTVITLLQTLAQHGIKKMVVASRPHTRQALESKLNTFSHEIHPLSADNQEDFLTRYWTARFGSNNNSERMKIYVKATMKNLSDSLEDHNDNLTSNPLITRLVAEIFGDDSGENKSDFDSCKEFMDSDVEQPKFPKKFDIIFLYESLIKKKFAIYFKKTSGDENTVGNEHDKIELWDRFIGTHKKLAVVALFEDDKVKQLLRDSTDRTPEQTERDITEEKTGIITAFIDGRPRFGHQTYAEYFAAMFFVDLLEKGDHNRSLRKIFVADVLLGNNRTTMRAFVNMLLSDKLISVLNGKSWKPHLNKHRSTSLGGTIFHVAAAEGNGRILRLFLNCPGWNSRDREALLDDKDLQNRTAVQWAFRYGNLNNIKLLSEHTDLKVNSPDPKTGFMPLHSSVLFGDLDVVKYVVENQAEINSQDGNGRTPLHLAAYEGGFDVVKYLVENKAEINCQDEDGYTPLHLVAFKGRFNVMKYLVKNKAEINSQNKRGCTPLHLAAQEGKLNVVKYLVKNGAEINSQAKNGSTPLHLAAMKGKFNVVKYLVANQVKINSQNKRGRMPLHLAAMKGKFDVVKYLVKNQAKINSQDKYGYTPLNLAAQGGKLDVVKYLVENKAEINSQNKRGRMPLHLAAMKGQFDVVKYLVENQAKINSQDKYGYTPLHLAAQGGELDVVKYLVEKEAEINFQDEDGYTPLHLAAYEGRFNVVEYLVENKAEINSQDKESYTPLHLVAFEGRFNVVKYLVENKAEIHSQNKRGRTPLHLAAQEGKFNVVKCLAENGAEINSPAKNGSTPLHLAAIKGKFDVVKYLVENQAEINSQNKRGRMPLHLAAMKGKFDVVKYLVENQAEINSQDKYGYTPLHLVAFNGEFDVVKYLVEDEAKINSQDGNGCTPLHLAAYEGRFKVVEYLVENKAEINSQDGNGRTPLHLAAENGGFEVVKYLVENKAEINFQDEDGYTPLHLAAQEGQFDVVEYLVENIAEINAQAKNGHTPLHLAVMKGKFDVVKYLVGNKAEINSQDEDGRTPLHLVAFEGRFNVVKYLVENKAEIHSQNKRGRTPLHLAAMKGKFDVVKYLVENQAKINSQDKYGYTPLHLAAQGGELDVVKYLVEKKAEINFQDEDGYTPLHLAAYEGRFNVVEYLVENKAEINCQDEDGYTPLHLVAFEGRFNVMKYLVKNKAEINSQNKRGCTPLHLAALEGKFDVVKYLVENKAEINAQAKNGSTPLHLAVTKSKFDVVKYLVENKAEIDSQNKRGRMPLHLAAMKGKFDVVKYLVENKAEINSQDEDGRTPLHVATHKGEFDVAEYLDKNGANMNS